MLTEGVAVAAIAAGGSVLAALVGALSLRSQSRDKRERARRQEEQDHINEQRDEMQYLMLTQQAAVGDGVKVLLRKAHGDHINGDCDRALLAIEGAEADVGRLKDRIVIEVHGAGAGAA